MAKVGARLVGILTILIIYNINICATNPAEENDKRPIADIKNQYQSVQTTDSSSAQQNVNGTSVSTGTSAAAAAAVAPSPSAAAPSPSSGVVPQSSQPLLGVNGTGQRKDMTDKISSTTVQPDISKTDGDSKKNLFPKKVGATPPVTKLGAAAGTSVVAAAAGGAPAPATTVKTEETDEEKLIDTIDVSEDDTLDVLKRQNLTVNQTTDHHQYYNSTISVEKEKVEKMWSEVKNTEPNYMLSGSHRRAMTVVLRFDFPFYGHNIRNVTVATGGFIYTGEYVHSWLAATQYIAPLMANFDTSLSNDSFVRLNDTGTSFTVIWENVSLQDKQDVGKFTFSTTLHNTGDIEFTYYSVPIFVNAIQDDKHPVKVGLSDAYIIEKVVYFARRKTIYEYHRVNFANAEITNNTVIYLKALPTCLQYTDCASCLNHNTNFTCLWCPSLKRCSTGTDRKKQEWTSHSCERYQTSSEDKCPAGNPDGFKPTAASIPNGNNNNQKDVDQHPFKPYNPSGIESSSTVTPLNGANSEYHSGTEMKSMIGAPEPAQKMGVTLGIFIPICLVSSILLWVLYAYRNPHTKSGQLLIQYRPSQWSWRRGEARYTAATIHM